MKHSNECFFSIYSDFSLIIIMVMCKINNVTNGVMAEPVDASDLKSGGGNTVWVQVPLAPYKDYIFGCSLFCVRKDHIV